MITISARALALSMAHWRGFGAVPAYLALADRIRLLILDGRIPYGARIPAERDLAAQLGVSRTTVTAAYSLLRQAGYLDSVRGSGSIATLPAGAVALTDIAHAGMTDLSKASMPALPQLVEVAGQAAAELGAYLGDTGFDPIGLPVLRQAIADRYTARGLPTTLEQVMVTIGAQHAIALVSRTLLNRGDRVLVEAPSYPHAYDALRGAGGRLIAAPVTVGQGWDAAMLEQILQRSSPALGYLMPDFHNPTGESMPAELREQVLEMAAAQGTVLIADETMAELGIDRASNPLPFAAYGPGAITIGSVGKTVWGGIRVGWIRAEAGMIQKLMRARSAGDLGTPMLEQLIVRRLLEAFDGVLDLRRAQLRAGREHLVAALRSRFPEWDVPRPDGGLTLWVGLGRPVSSQLTLAARQQGLLLAAGPRFGLDGAFERFLRIPFSVGIEELDIAVDALAAAWSDLAGVPTIDGNYFADVI